MGTHEELVAASFFDEKFKNALRDYYNYGFKNLISLQEKSENKPSNKSASTIRSDWERLNMLLQDYFVWSDKNEQKSIMFMTREFGAVGENPFHRVYRFCKFNENDIVEFFNIIMLLSSKVNFRYDTEYARWDEWELFDRISGKMQSSSGWETSELIYPLAQLRGTSGDDKEDKSRNYNRRLMELQRLGYLADRQKYGQKGGKGKHYWQLNDDTMAELLKKGKGVNTEFEEHLQNALSFYTQYFMLGEIGENLRMRMMEKSKSPYRFRHGYHMKALNDFNLIDILYAIENQKWCNLHYRHGIQDTEVKVLCMPLEIRDSNNNGRTHVMVYEFERKCISGLRLEFIDGIEYIENRQLVGKAGWDHEAICKDIEKARELIAMAWGVSMQEGSRGNPIDEVTVTPVRLELQYDPVKEFYIPPRVEQERRHAPLPLVENNTVTYSVDVTDVREMRPWIRSFYGRLTEVHGVESKDFQVLADVENSLRNMRDGAFETHHGFQQKDDFKNVVETVEWKKTSAMKPHDTIFHETFSIYYILWAELLDHLQRMGNANNSKIAVTADELEELLTDAICKWEHQIGERTDARFRMELLKLLKNPKNGFLHVGYARVKETLDGKKRVDASTWQETKPKDNGRWVRVYCSRYRMKKGLSFYKDILPLSTPEKKWLRTILDDSKISCFFSPEEIDAMKVFLGEEIRAFPVKSVVHYDRFFVDECTNANVKKYLAPLTKAIQENKIVRLKYKAVNGGAIIECDYYPIFIEYSQRNDRFQLRAIDVDQEQLYPMRIENILELEILDTKFDYDELLNEAERIIEGEERHINVIFPGTKNTADRILTEFSPWKKKCVLAENGLYTMTLYYNSSEWAELVIRLMGYGPNIYLPDWNHPIRKTILERLEKQIKLLEDSPGSVE